MPRTTSITTTLTMMTIAVLLIPFPCKAAIHGDVELLKTVARQHKANLESLLTWKGEVFEEIISTRGDKYDYMMKNKCIFAYDHLQNAIRWNKQPQENRFEVDGKTLHDINAFYNSAMLKGQTSYEYSALGLKDSKEAHHLIIDEGKHAKDLGNITTLDPRFFLANPGGGGNYP